MKRRVSFHVVHRVLAWMHVIANTGRKRNKSRVNTHYLQSVFIPCYFSPADHAIGALPEQLVVTYWFFVVNEATQHGL